MIIARHFSAGTSAYFAQSHRDDRNADGFSRPCGTVVIANPFPGTEVPGYSHGVPLGRENELNSTFRNASTTDDEEPVHSPLRLCALLFSFAVNGHHP